MTFRPRVFTFYSYKGGVGRSMALLNTAYYLHSKGRHVLVVDLDLDAPGASGFLHRKNELEEASHSGDVVDVLRAVIAAVKSARDSAPVVPALRLESFLRPVRPDRYAPAAHPRAPRARFDVLAADDARDYPMRLGALGLSALNAKQIGDASQVLRDLLTAHRFPFHQPWQEPDEAPEKTGYDYILVDSRTGFSEIGGLCVGPLSDRLVVLSGLNDQNIEGTRRFLDLVGLEPPSSDEKREKWDDADETIPGSKRPATLGPKPTLLVASPVPAGELEYKGTRMKELEERMCLKPVKLSYHPQMALMETLFVRDHEDEYLALEYRKLGGLMMAMVNDSSDAHSSRLDAMLNRSRSKEVETGAFDLLPQTVARMTLAEGATGFIFPMPFAFFKRVGVPDNIRRQIFRLRISLAASQDQAAEAALAWAEELQSDDSEPAKSPGGRNAIEERYREAIRLKPDFHEALNNWGSTLGDWAKTKQGAEADQLFAEAEEKYGRALTFEPHDHEVLRNWGATLGDWAKTRQGAEADQFFTKAMEKYSQALAIEPDDHDVLHNWGATLGSWAKTKQGVEADQLFAQAVEKYGEALVIESDNHEVLRNWGATLGEWAKRKQGAEGDQLFAQAMEKYDQALAIEPDDHEVLNNWGATLGNYAKKKKGAEADELMGQAESKFEQGLAIKPDDAGLLFNISCLHALRKDVASAVSTLVRWKKVAKLATKKELDRDSDFDGIRETPEFVRFRESLED